MEAFKPVHLATNRSGQCSKTQTASSPDVKEVMLRQSPPSSILRHYEKDALQLEGADVPAHIR
jgi:hypothetical protein